MVTAGDNPFRVDRIEALPYRSPGFAWDDFLARLVASGYQGAVVGPHGSGKTTLLLEAQRRLAAAGVPVFYGFLNEETAHRRRQVWAWLREIPADTVLFLDGAEQLDRLTWWRVRRAARKLRGLVVTVHRPGRLPTLHRTAPSEALLTELLAQLEPGGGEASHTRARAYFRQFRGDIRAVFFALYDDRAHGRT